MSPHHPIFVVKKTSVERGNEFYRSVEAIVGTDGSSDGSVKCMSEDGNAVIDTHIYTCVRCDAIDPRP